MLTGTLTTLRQIRDGDLELLWQRHADIDDRVLYFPIGVMSLPKFSRQYSENGFCSEEEGMLVISDREGGILGHIEFFRTANYLDEFELSYQIYGKENRNRGVATEVVQLLTRYLFEKSKWNRIRLMIHPDNKASVRVAEKAGYTFESIALGVWYNRGVNHDLAIYRILRREWAALVAPSSAS